MTADDLKRLPDLFRDLEWTELNAAHLRSEIRNILALKNLEIAFDDSRKGHQAPHGLAEPFRATRSGLTVSFILPDYSSDLNDLLLHLKAS